jgi:phosphate transport system protein
MGRLLDAGLEQLTTTVYKMGEMAEKSIRVSVRGFLSGKDVTEEVRDLSEILVTMTVTIEDKATELSVKYQPVASDLRIINSYMKIAYDFERFGRYAWDISSTFKRLGEKGKCLPLSDPLVNIAEKVSEMVHTSVSALKDNDAELAKTLAKTEKEVDQLYFGYLDQLADSSADIKCAMSNILVARYLERIADHTTYVGESIVYIATGEKVAIR